MNLKRVKKINNANFKKGKILYWMSREQRVNNNWSLIFALNLAKKYNVELIVVFNLVPSFLGATLRQYDFMIKGLEEVEKNLNNLNINFKVLIGDLKVNILNYIKKNNIGIIVSDFDPLKIKKEWQKEILANINIPFFLVDSHNIVPVWQASNKQEFAAYTIRPKIKKLLLEYLEDFDKIDKQKLKVNIEKNNWDLIYNSINVDKNVKVIDWLKPGESNAQKVLKYFIDNKLNDYLNFRNDPTKDYLSNLSVYLHFGHISSQDIALKISQSFKSQSSIDAFLEELIIRKELSDNYCFYNQNYDNINGIPIWAKNSLDLHEDDKRDYIYSKEEFEFSKTYDDLWNASQNELRIKGKMHGFMRMYWAKKILEWTKNAKEAIEIAIYLNDKYSLDGRDPNGYVGILWSIGGLHDRAWFERSIFGKIRYMSYNGCKKKFDIKKYIEMNKI